MVNDKTLFPTNVVYTTHDWHDTIDAVRSIARSGGLVGMDIKTFRRTTPSSVGRLGIDRSFHIWTELLNQDMSLTVKHCLPPGLATMLHRLRSLSRLPLISHNHWSIFGVLRYTYSQSHEVHQERVVKFNKEKWQLTFRRNGYRKSPSLKSKPTPIETQLTLDDVTNQFVRQFHLLCRHFKTKAFCQLPTRFTLIMTRAHFH